MTEAHVGFVTDKMTELSLMMSSGANASKIRSASSVIVRQLKKDKPFSKTVRLSLLSKFDLIAKHNNPASVLKDILNEWDRLKSQM